MSITASGMYGLTLEKSLNAAVAFPTNGVESETAVKGLLVTDSYTPNYDTHDFRDDVTNEVTGTGYTAGGTTLTATELTIVSGVLAYDSADLTWATSTITNAMGLVAYFARGGASSADELLFLSDFVNPATTVAGPLVVQVHSSGWWTHDYTP
jgi:hypothetical protein